MSTEIVKNHDVPCVNFDFVLNPERSELCISSTTMCFFWGSVTTCLNINLVPCRKKTRLLGSRVLCFCSRAGLRYSCLRYVSKVQLYLVSGIEIHFFYVSWIAYLNSFSTCIYSIYLRLDILETFKSYAIIIIYNLYYILKL